MHLRDCLVNLLGIPRTRCDLNPQHRGNIELGGVVVEKWLYCAETGSRISANLYRPGNVSGRIPGIVMTSGHGDSKSMPHMILVAHAYARAGIACLVADPLGEEERHAAGATGTRAHDAPDVAYRCDLAGRSVMGKFVFDAMRGLDFMETLPWIDSGRLGVAGNSLGGAVAGWLFALDPRLRMTIVSGWAFSDTLAARYGKHCTRVPNLKLRAICEWEEFLALGASHSALLVMNGDADVIIDKNSSGIVWKDTVRHLASLDPSEKRMQTWFCPAGGHRPYHGNARALGFIHDILGTPLWSARDIESLPKLHYGTWCDRHGIALEPLYGVELHYRGAILPDLGLQPVSREQLAVLAPEEIGGADFTIDGWLAAQ